MASTAHKELVSALNEDLRKVEGAADINDAVGMNIVMFITADFFQAKDLLRSCTQFLSSWAEEEGVLALIKALGRVRTATSPVPTCVINLIRAAFKTQTGLDSQFDDQQFYSVQQVQEQLPLELERACTALHSFLRPLKATSFCRKCRQYHESAIPTTRCSCGGKLDKWELSFKIQDWQALRKANHTDNN